MAYAPQIQPAGSISQRLRVPLPNFAREILTMDEPQITGSEPSPIKSELPVEGASVQAVNTPVVPAQAKEPVPTPPMLESQAEQMAAKESAIVEALGRLQKIHKKVEKTRAKSSDIDLIEWAAQLESVEADNTKFEFLVGAAGNTGMGKSSLLNALIGEAEDLAPSSQNGACTAAVCCFHHHDSRKATHPYLARVKFKSKAAVDKELAAYFFEYKRIYDAAALDGEPDADIRAQRDRLKEQMRVIEGWTGLERDEIEKMGLGDRVSDITIRCLNGAKIFDYKDPSKHKVHDIGAATPKKFLYTIRPYIGNVNRKEKILLLWPLVDIVHIYVDAPLLLTGVVLVDLPGEMDAIESRAQVAKNYYNKLDRLMVVAPHDRACDDRTAADLIRDDQLVGLEADGKMNNDGFCVVVTKVDQLECEHFVESEWDPADVSADFPALFNAFRERRDDLEAVKEQIKELKEDLHDYRREVDRVLACGLAFPEDPTDDPEVNEQLRELSTLCIQEREIELDVSRLDQQCLRECLDTRNRDIVAKMKDLVLKRRQDVVSGAQSGAVPQVNVFPVSSRAHRNLLKGRPQPAFSNDKLTGIFALQEWIMRGASLKRNQHVDDLLSRCHVLFDTIEGWAIEQWFVKLRLPETDYPGIEKVLKGHQKTLKSDFETLEQELQAYIKSQDMIKTEAYIRSTAKCAEKFLNHVKSYNTTDTGDRMKWGTYAACIRRSGGPFKTSTYPKNTYCWQEKTNTYFWRSHSKHWGQAYSENVPKYVYDISTKFQGKVDMHLAAIAMSMALPEEYKDAFKQDSFKVENLAQYFKVRLHQLASEFRKETQEIRVQSKDWINEPLMPVYEEARNITGKGMNVRQIETMERFARSNGYDVFASVGARIEAMLQRGQQTFSDMMTGAIDSFISEVSIVEKNVGKNVCSLDKSLGQAYIPATAVQSLKDSVKRDVEDWRRMWQALLARIPAEQGQSMVIIGGKGGDKDTSPSKKRPLAIPTSRDDEMPPAKVPRAVLKTSPLARVVVSQTEVASEQTPPKQVAPPYISDEHVMRGVSMEDSHANAGAGSAVQYAVGPFSIAGGPTIWY